MNLMELIQKKKQDLNAGKRAKTVKPPDGTSRFRILPGWRGEADPTFFHDFGQHFIKDVAGDIKAVYVCVDKTYGKPCDVCAGLAKAIHGSVDDLTINVLKEAQATGRILVNALHTSGDNPNEPVILELAPSVFNDICSIVQEWGGDVLSLDKGRDIQIERNGKGKLTKYSVQITAKSTVIDPAIMKKVVNLDEYVSQESEEAQRRTLANISMISGVLAAPVTPRAAALSDFSIPDEDEDLTQTIPGAGADVPAAVVEEAAAVIEKAAATPAPAAAPAAPASTGDSELDDLLAELG